MLKRIFLKLTIWLELFTHIVPLPFGIYFSVVTGSGSYLSLDEFKLVAFAGITNATILIVLGCIWRYFYLKKLLLEILKLYKTENVSQEEKVNLKVKLLRYPFQEAKVIVLRWLTGIIGSHLLIVSIVGVRPGLHLTAPFLFFMIVPISYIAYFFITENGIRKLFRLRKVKEIEIEIEKIPQFNSFQRIIFSMVAILLMPIIILGYMLFGIHFGLVTIENPVFHLFLMSLLFPIPVLIVGYVVAKTFRNGIMGTNEHLDQLGKGNFSIVSMPTSADDFGLQAFNLNRIIKKLNSMYSEILILNTSLEEKVLQRTLELQEERDNLKLAKEKIETLAESRKKLSLIGTMAAGIVHDIKNPMATIKAIAERANSTSISAIKREKYLQIIVQEMDRLNDLAYEILDFSKGELLLDKEEINLEEFFKEIEEFLRLNSEYAGVKYFPILDYTGNVNMDKSRMRRVIVNLAKNAIEAMYDGLKDYEFTIKCQKIEDNPDNSLDSKEYLLISLKDNGPGLPESVEARIFEAFATEGKAKGTGLGLFMCKWIVETHQGSLTYDTKRGEGTTFFIKLPL